MSSYLVCERGMEFNLVCTVEPSPSPPYTLFFYPSCAMTANDALECS